MSLNDRDPHSLIVQVLDDIKQRNGFTSNYALAQYLKVPDIYISRWYAGEYGTTAIRVLTPELIAFGQRQQLQAA